MFIVLQQLVNFFLCYLLLNFDLIDHENVNLEIINMFHKQFMKTLFGGMIYC